MLIRYVLFTLITIALFSGCGSGGSDSSGPTQTPDPPQDQTPIPNPTPTPVISGSILYVAPDVASGTCAITPDYYSIADALAAANAGDGVRLLPGTYTTPVSFPHGGDVGNPIILTYTPASECNSGGGMHSAIIDCTNAGNVNCVTSDHGNVVIDGLEVRGAFYNGIKVDGHVHGTSDQHSYGCWGGYCDTEGHYNTNGADNVVIQNNHVHDIGYDGIKIGHVNNIAIEGNEIYNTGRNSTQQGIDLVGAYGVVIRNNLVHDDNDATMLIGLFAKGGSENILIENNYVANILPPFAAIEIGGDTEWYNTRYTASEVSFDINTEILTNNYNSNLINCSGIYSGNACPYETATMAEARHAVIRGNIIVNSDPGLSFRNAYDVKVYNNTVINSGWDQGWIKLWTDGNHSHPSQDLKFYNNLFYNDSVELIRGVAYDKQQGTVVDNTVGFVFENNLLHPMGGGTPTLGMPANLIPVSDQLIADPLLDNLYQPQPGSPAIDAGLDLISRGVTTVEYEAAHPFTDSNGISFPQNGFYDIGAFEFMP